MNARVTLLLCSLSCLAGAAAPGWTALPNTKLQSVCPPGFRCANVIAAWSGGIADTKRNRLILWGGGHGDYNGNEVYALDLNANPATLTRIIDPSPVNPDPATCVTTLPDGNPNSRHTYNGLAYLANVDKMFAFNGSLSCNAGGHASDTWTLDFPTLKWTRQDPVNGSPLPTQFYGSPVSMAAYDPNTGTVILNNLGMLFRYDYSANKYTVLNSSATPPFSSTPVVDPKRKLLFYIGSNVYTTQSAAVASGPPSIKVVDLAAGSNYAMQDWTSQVTGCNALAASTNPGLAYDSALDKIVGWPNFGDTVYIFDPATKSCSTQTYAGGPPASTDYNGQPISTGTFGRFEYFPALDAFVVMNFWTNDAYMLRLGSASTPADSVPPSTPANVTASAVSSSQINLSWTASTDNVGVVGYKIYRGGTQITSLTSGTTYSDTSCAAGVSYSYTVAAYDGAGNTSAQSAAAAATTPAAAPVDTQAPSVPTGLTATATSSSDVRLAWTASTDNVAVAGYKVFRGGVQIANATSGLSVQDSGLSAGASYSYTVAAYDAAGNISAQSAAATVVMAGGGSSSTPPPTTPSVANTLTITNSGAAATNFPVQIGRPFIKGEIPSGTTPQASLNGSPVPTQVDVKARWADGSLKHAVISFLIPAFGAGQSVKVSFAPGASVGNTPLTTAGMLDASYNFDAQIQLTNAGVKKSVSARTMLEQGAYTVWTAGPIATTVVIADHAQTTTCGGKPASRYDMGFDSYCAFRPVFEATFWPATRQVSIRFVGEISNSEQLEDVTVTGLDLVVGNNAPSTSYSLPAAKSPLTMYAGSRWTKRAWLNGAPPAAAVNHNIGYVSATLFVPNYDTAKTVPQNTLASAYTAWQGRAKDLYDAGEWQKAMGSAGGRPDIGPYPTWVARWLYTGDIRVQEESIGNAELATAWAMHYREGSAAKFLDRAKSVPGVGRVLSVSTRPTLCWLCGSTPYNYSYTAAADRLVPVGPVTNGGWLPDLAHQPDPFSPLYALTGDFFYLEEMQFWAAYSAAASNGAAVNSPTGRGPTGGEGGLPGSGSLQIRGQAWSLRSRAQTAFMTPDGAPEKAYFDALTQDALAIWEGQRNITGTSYQGNANWNWGLKFGLNNGANSLWGSLGIPALHFWEPGDPAFVQYPVDSAVASSAISTWEQNFLIFALGRARELGFPADALLQWVGTNLIGQATDSTYNPWLTGAYRLPTVKGSTGKYFTSWADLKTGFVAAAQTGTSFDPMYIYTGILDNPSDGYPYFASAAMSMVADQPGGAQGWAFMQKNVESYPAVNTDPKWALLPRAASAPPTNSGSKCDLNGDGKVDQADIQSAVNQALGTLPCTTADLQHNGTCTVVGVQRIINASNGGQCVLN